SIDLTGVITSIALSPERDPMLWLEGGKGEPRGVQCMTRAREPWKQVLPGQTVKLRGKGPEFSLGAALIECDILDVTGDPPPMLTPDPLAAEHAKGPEATEKKYDKKQLVVEGEIAKIDINDLGLPKITLKT